MIEPELLDELPPEDPEAIRSRRDLRLINLLMGNAPLLARLLREVPRPATILELGSGDGTFMLGLARRLSQTWPGVHVRLLDMQPVIKAQTLDGIRKLGWSAEIMRANLMDWLRADAPPHDLLLANLFLHHFSGEQLRGFFEVFAARATAFASCDPRRWRPALFTCRFLWALGCNRVTRHDAMVSVRAGFRDHELSGLWPPGEFTLTEKPGAFASHLFLARRTAKREASPGCDS